ncbi:MAG: bifunctional salicylyl-CoA 5-hydroxylase/oxidoreductase [Gammaproteobacteria bacterium]
MKKVTIIGGGPGGLYFGILAKKEWPHLDIEVFERNRRDDTFGFGVVFSDQTLGFLNTYDNRSYESIRRSFAYWDDVDVHYQGQRLRSAGNGFCGCSRLTLLQLLYDRAEELGIKIHFESDVSPDQTFDDSDLIIVADGVNSAFRERHAEHFGTHIELRRNQFCWLGSTRPLEAFKYFFRKTEHGIMVMHAYQYEEGMSTWICEMQPETWQAHGFDKLDEQSSAQLVQKIFAEDLDGHALITNRSLWRQFPIVKNKTWIKDRMVLIGDAQHTAHYSIGSGTKLAMESSIALYESLKKIDDVDAALANFDKERRMDVEITQHAADVSLAWFESMDEHWDVEPEKFAFQVMSRSKQITYENLRLRDNQFVDDVVAAFIKAQRKAGYTVADHTPPMFAPFKLRDMTLTNRVVMSPMAQYSATDGLPNDWHLVHYGSRGIGGSGLIYTEMTCPSADARITPGCTGIWNEEQTGAWSRIVDFVHSNSPAKMCMQIGHAGRKGSTRLAWDGMDLPLETDNWPIVSASPIPYREESATPTELSAAQMQEIKNEFVRAVGNAERAGFDMIEMHSAHGYLLASFLSPLTNTRNDEFGGSVENRLRFPLEIFVAMRDAWPQNKPMSVRISATDWYEGGLNEDELLEICHAFKQAGVDVINVSTGQTVSFEQPVYGRMFQVPFADKIKHRVGIPTIVAGNITNADQVNTVILSGRADLVALARPHLTNAQFTADAAARLGFQDQHWPNPYMSGKFQAYLVGEREEEERRNMQLALRPASHQLKDDDHDD